MGMPRIRIKLWALLALVALAAVVFAAMKLAPGRIDTFRHMAGYYDTEADGWQEGLKRGSRAQWNAFGYHVGPATGSLTKDDVRYYRAAQAYATKMAAKYACAAQYPWFPVWPDPPRPGPNPWPKWTAASSVPGQWNPLQPQ
jgi:hypothetical protein